MEMSRLTSKYQATIPADVRAALGVKAGDRLGWEVREGVATVQKMEETRSMSGVTVIDSNVFAEWLSDEDIEDWG
jgi:antitoxin PrlF